MKSLQNGRILWRRRLCRRDTSGWKGSTQMIGGHWTATPSGLLRRACLWGRYRLWCGRGPKPEGYGGRIIEGARGSSRTSTSSQTNTISCELLHTTTRHYGCKRCSIGAIPKDTMRTTFQLRGHIRDQLFYGIQPLPSTTSAMPKYIGIKVKSWRLRESPPPAGDARSPFRYSLPNDPFLRGFAL